VKKFLVEFVRNCVECSIEVEAIDLAEAKKKVAKWRKERFRHTNDEVRIKSVKEIA
jgi:hypothetical protein